MPSLTQPKANGRKVAIVGGGPAGLATAAMLAQKGFTAEVFADCIWLNDGSGQGMSGMALYLYPNGDTTAWDEVDVTDIDSWTPLYNSTETWAFGAFSHGMDPENPFDYGWGAYNMTNHNVEGDSLHVVRMPDGTLKKLQIYGKFFQQGSYTWRFRYADIDGQNEVLAEFPIGESDGKRFIHYSLANAEKVDNEPMMDSWDVVFKKYADNWNDMGSIFPVTGVQVNANVKIAKYVDTDPETATYQEADFNRNISAIGYDWWELGEDYTYLIVPNRVYFLHDTVAQEIYKFTFDSYNGTTGNIDFTTERVATNTAVNAADASPRSLALWPNPAADRVSLVYDMPGQGNALEVELFNLMGQRVLQAQRANQGFGTWDLDLGGLSAGTYLVRLSDGQASVTQRLVVR